MKASKTVSLMLITAFLFLNCISSAACIKILPPVEPIPINPGNPAASFVPPATEIPTAASESPHTAEASPSPVPDTTAAPTAKPTPAPTPVTESAAPSPYPNRISLGTKDMPARFTMPTELYGLSEAECESFFSDAVFVGDSLTKGWVNYNNLMLEKNPDFFGQTRFFCEGSYGTGNALKPISDDSIHPMYGGEQHYIWDAVTLMKAKKMFILLGMNDISIFKVKGTADNYAKVISKVRQQNPDTEIFIISCMYMYKGSEREFLNNKNIYALNRLLAEFCSEQNYEFVNIASHLIDENGFVPDDYSSDKYVHQTYKAYKIWADILRSVAARHILGMERPVFY